MIFTTASGPWQTQTQPTPAHPLSSLNFTCVSLAGNPAMLGALGECEIPWRGSRGADVCKVGMAGGSSSFHKLKTAAAEPRNLKPQERSDFGTRDSQRTRSLSDANWVKCFWITGIPKMPRIANKWFWQGAHPSHSVCRQCDRGQGPRDPSAPGQHHPLPAPLRPFCSCPAEPALWELRPESRGPVPPPELLLLLPCPRHSH